MKTQMEALQKFITNQEKIMYGHDEEKMLKYLDEIPIDELKEIKLSPLTASVKAD